jgi:hypothetical protein
MLNWAPCHETVWGSGGIAPLFLDLSSEWSLSHPIHFTPQKDPPPQLEAVMLQFTAPGMLWKTSIQFLTWAGTPWQHCLAGHSQSRLHCVSLCVGTSAPGQSPLAVLLPVDPIQEPGQLWQVRQSMKIKCERIRLSIRTGERITGAEARWRLFRA